MEFALPSELMEYMPYALSVSPPACWMSQSSGTPVTWAFAMYGPPVGL